MINTKESMEIVSFTDRAKEEIKQLIAKDPNPEIGLRLGVKGGGCSGLSYILDIGTEKEGDNVQIFDNINVFIDKKSSLYLQGMQVDYSADLIDRGFKFNNPNAANTCGCGTSFSV